MFLDTRNGACTLGQVLDGHVLPNNVGTLTFGDFVLDAITLEDILRLARAMESCTVSKTIRFCAPYGKLVPETPVPCLRFDRWEESDDFVFLESKADIKQRKSDG
jgi:hypothetical protein